MNLHDLTFAAALDGGKDWRRQLRRAQILAQSDNPVHRKLAVHIEDAAALDDVGLLRPAPIRKADLLPSLPPPETTRDVILRHRQEWPLIVAYGALLAVVMLAGTRWLI